MLFPRILHRLHRSVKPSSHPADSSGGASLAGALFGWPPPKLDPARDTAWLDGLRGVAALLVMVYHYHLNFWGVVLEAPFGDIDDQKYQIWRLPFLRIFMCAGHAQVSVFFVMSGFVLSWSPLASLRRGRAEKLAGSLASATFRRWLRLYLPCFAIGVVSLFEGWFGFVDPPGGRKDSFLQQTWDFLKASERFADPFHVDRDDADYRHDYNWTMWTIPREFNGSLLVFLLVLSVSRIQDYTRRTLVIGVVVLYSLVKARWDYWLFASGVMLADHVQENGGFMEATKPQQKLLWSVVMVVSLFLAGVPEHSPFYGNTGYGFLERFVPSAWSDVESGRRFWWCWAGILFVTACCHLTTPRRLFSLPSTRYLGRVSYMLYVTHRIVWEMFGLYFKKWVAVPFLTRYWSEEWKVYLYKGSGLATCIVLALVWLGVGPLAIFVAHWSEVFIDRPSVELAKRLEQALVNGFAYQPVPHQEEMSQLPS